MDGKSLAWLPQVSIGGAMQFTALLAAHLALVTQLLQLYMLVAPVTLVLVSAVAIWLRFQVHHLVALGLGAMSGALLFLGIGLVGSSRGSGLSLEFFSWREHFTLVQYALWLGWLLLSCQLYILFWLPVTAIFYEVTIFFCHDAIAWKQMRNLRQQAWQQLQVKLPGE